MSCHCCQVATSKHTPITCPFRKALYCYICADTGHSPKRCPNQTAVALRNGMDPKKVKNRELHVVHTEDAVRECLTEHGISPLTSFEDNKALLKDYAYSLQEPKMVVYVPHK